MDNTDKPIEQTRLIEDIRSGGEQREIAWRSITQAWGASIMNTAMKQTNCNEWQAREAFSIASVGVDKRAKNAESAEFLKKASLKTYLTQATIFEVFRILKSEPKTKELEQTERWAAEDVEVRQRMSLCTKLMDRALENIGQRCKKILTMFNNGYKMEQIAREMGFENADVAKREKYKCVERFKAFLLANPSLSAQLKENCYG